MSKKLYGLISTLVTCAGTAAGAVVGYFQPENWGTIVSAIAIAVPAINDILLLFVTDKEAKK
jgi:hypothetical protein